MKRENANPFLETEYVTAAAKLENNNLRERMIKRKNKIEQMKRKIKKIVFPITLDNCKSSPDYVNRLKHYNNQPWTDMGYSGDRQ